MQNISIQKAGQLPPEARRAVERLLGRPLQAEEEVSVMALLPHEAPMGPEKEAIARRLAKRIKTTAERARDVSEEIQEEIINEAVKQVRSRPR